MILLKVPNTIYIQILDLFTLYKDSKKKILCLKKIIYVSQFFD